MFEPKFSYTDRLVYNLVRLESLKTTLIDTDIHANIKGKLQLQAKAYDMLHLAHMLDIELTLRDAERIASGVRLEGNEDPRFGILYNFRNILEFSRSSMADTYAEIDFPILLHLNKLLLVNWRESWDVKIRGVGDVIDDRWDDLIEYRDKSIEESQIDEILRDLIEWYKDVTPIMTPLVRYMILIYKLFEIYPFVAGNKFSIIGIADYLLLKTNLASRSYTSVVRFFDQHSERLLQAYKQSRANFDMSTWLEVFSELIIKDLREMKENMSIFVMEEEKSKKQPFLDLNKRQLKALRYLQSVPTIKREDYCHMMEVSTMTAFRDLNDLARKKLIKIEGQGRGTKYRLASM